MVTPAKRGKGKQTGERQSADLVATFEDRFLIEIRRLILADRSFILLILGSSDFYETSYARVVNTSGYENILAVNMITALTQEKFRDTRDSYFIENLNPAIDTGEIEVLAGKSSVGFLQPDYINYYKFGGIIDMEIPQKLVSLTQTHALSINSSTTHSSVKSLKINEIHYRIYSGDKSLYMGEKQVSHITWK